MAGVAVAAAAFSGVLMPTLVMSTLLPPERTSYHLILFAIDTQAGITPQDEEIARLLALADKQAAREDYRGAAQTKRDALRLIANRATSDEAEDYDAVVEGEMGRAKKKLPKPSQNDTLLE